MRFYPFSPLQPAAPPLLLHCHQPFTLPPPSAHFCPQCQAVIWSRYNQRWDDAAARGCPVLQFPREVARVTTAWGLTMHWRFPSCLWWIKTLALQGFFVWLQKRVISFTLLNLERKKQHFKDNNAVRILLLAVTSNILSPVLSLCLSQGRGQKHIWLLQRK